METRLSRRKRLRYTEKVRYDRHWVIPGAFHQPGHP